MNNYAKKDLLKMQNLMERMENHMTINEAEQNLKEKLIKEGLEENGERVDYAIANGQGYALSSPEELIKVLSTEGMSPSKAWYVTLGYISKYGKLGNKTIKSKVDAFDQDAVDNAKKLGSERLNKIIDNPVLDKKGQITNPYMTDSYTNYIVEASIIRLMYGRNEEYGKQKQAVKNDLEKYQQEHPNDVQEYLDSTRMIDFVKQSYGDERNSYKTKIPNVNGFQLNKGGYELDFNTPKSVFKKLKTVYFLITDEDHIEEISKDEAEAYANLFGIVPAKRPFNGSPVAQKVDQDIRAIKNQHHGNDVWTNYNLNSVFLLNFSVGGNNKQTLQYYNPDAIVEFVQGRELKSGTVPSRYTSKGLFKPHLDKLR